jgi:hypothetical protein
MAIAFVVVVAALAFAAASPSQALVAALILLIAYALATSGCASNAEWNDDGESFAARVNPWLKRKTLSFEEQCVEAAPVVPGSAGLTNVGNSCYINSVVQCLAAVPPLRAFLDAQPPPKSPALRREAAGAAAVAATRAAISSRMSPQCIASGVTAAALWEYIAPSDGAVPCDDLLEELESFGLSGDDGAALAAHLPASCADCGAIGRAAFDAAFAAANARPVPDAARARGDVAAHLAQLTRAMSSQRYSALGMDDFKAALDAHTDAFHGAQQHDAAELYCALLDAVRSDIVGQCAMGTIIGNAMTVPVMSRIIEAFLQAMGLL